MYLLFDIGASKMRLAVSRDGQTFETPTVVPTPDNLAELVVVFKQTASELLDGQMPEALAGGVTRKHEGAKAEISKLFSSPSFLENDSALCGLGEALSGAGRGANILVYLTVSTGVGGARIVEGKIDQAETGFEPGQQILELNGVPKTLEELVSGRGLTQRLGLAPKAVTDAAVWNDLARLLADGIYNSVLHWSPEVVILGGSMMTGTPRIDLAAVTTYFHQIPTNLPTLPELRLATLGDFGGLHGALHFLKQKLAN